MINTENLFQVLSAIHPLPRTFKEALSKELQIISYPKNHFLVQMFSVAHYAYFLENGFAVAYHFHDGKKIVTTFFKSFDIIFSPRSFFANTQAAENIQLTVDSDLISISSSSAHKLFDEFPVANFLARAITAEYHSKSQERHIDLHRMSTWERYEKLQNNFPRIELCASQELIASYLNITPQSLSRLKHDRN